MLTLILSNLGFYLLIRRGNRKGRSLLLACTVILCAGAPQFCVHFPSMGPAFRTQEFYALGTVTTLAGIAYVIMLARAPRYLREGVRELRTIRVG